MVVKKNSKEKGNSKDVLGPGSYKIKSFVDNDIIPNVIFGSSPRFKKPPVSESIDVANFNQNKSTSGLALNRYFDKMGKEGPFVTIKGRRPDKRSDSLPGPGNYNIK